MKKINLVATCLVLFLLSLNANAQAKIDYFVGNWDILVTGTPNGDAKMILSLERKDGKLDGTVKLGDQAEVTKLFDIVEAETLITFNITAGDYVVRFSLEKKDDNHISGTMMDQFDTKGERILKEEKTSATVQNTADFFVGQWNLLVAGTPDGDIKMIVSLERKEGKLNGTIKILDLELSKFSNVEEKGTSIKLYFSAAGYDLYISLQKKDDNHVTGSEMDMFDIKGERMTK